MTQEQKLRTLKILQPRMHETFKKRPKVIPSEKDYDRKKQKRELSEELRRVAFELMQGKYVRVPGKGKKPTLWYWENSKGKRFLVDQKSEEN
jgi:hypothetical protein